jgi:hypothetical protein
MPRIMICATLALLASCSKKSDDSKGTSAEKPATTDHANKPAPDKPAPDKAPDKPAPDKPLKADPKLEAAIRAVVANCKIDERYGGASACKSGEHDAAKKAIVHATPLGSIETIAVLAHDADAGVRRYVAGLSYDTVSSHVGLPYFYKAAAADPKKAVRPEVATQLIAALPKVEGQSRFYLAPLAIHAALLDDMLEPLEKALATPDNASLRNVLISNLMVFPRMAHFAKVKAHAGGDKQAIRTAIEATQRMPAPTADERGQICPWAAGFLTADPEVAATAAHAMIRCGGEYIDKLQAEGETRVAAGTFVDPLSMAFREICFTPLAGTAVAGSPEQCAKNFAFLEAVGNNEKLTGQVRGQALWNIYYQRRDRKTLDLLRGYEKHKDPDVARQVRDAIKSLFVDYKLDDGKGIPPAPTTWTTNATEHKDAVGKTFEVNCPPKGTAGTIYGTGTYTHDSSVCTAAVHAGKIKLETGGKVRFLIKAGLDKYEASEKNGVRSSGYGKYPASFTVL